MHLVAPSQNAYSIVANNICVIVSRAAEGRLAIDVNFQLHFSIIPFDVETGRCLFFRAGSAQDSSKFNQRSDLLWRRTRQSCNKRRLLQMDRPEVSGRGNAIARIGFAGLRISYPSCQQDRTNPTAMDVTHHFSHPKHVCSTNQYC